MKIDFTMPFAPDPNPAETAKRLMRSVQDEGRAAYRAGVPLHRCPDFKIADMRIDWKLGWRWEQEAWNRHQEK